MTARTAIGAALLGGLAPLGSAQSTLAVHEGGMADKLSLSIGGRDLNLDGVDDFLLATPHDGQDAGLVSARCGASGATLWTSQGASGDRFGHSVAFIDDMTGDGVPEVVVGAPGAQEAPGSWPGAVVILSGVHGGVFLERFGANDGEEAGHAVATGFDYDRDGVGDFAGGAPQGPHPVFPITCGLVHVWSGANGTLLSTWNYAKEDAELGSAVAGVGDVNGDGFDDLGMGSPGWEPLQGPIRTGSVNVVSDGLVVLLVLGSVQHGALGSALAPADDYDNDGYADFLVGATGEANASGQVHLISGDTGATLANWTGSAPFDHFGFSLARIGDVDADGKRDFAVGAPQPQGYGPGYARVVSLKFGSELYTVTGAAIGHEFGGHVGAVGDVNQDGVPDVGVGAPGWDDFSGFPFKINAGRVTFYSGGCPGFVNYCTPGTSASGCSAEVSGSGTPSWFAPSGFTLSAMNVEGDKSALFFFGWNGRQANSWGNGTSYQCVVPPVKRGGVLAKSGTPGACDGSYSQDLNALWSANPNKNPGPGAVVQAQLWHRDPENTSNQTTTFSDALEFVVCN